MAQVFILDESATAVLNGLREFAEANHISAREMERMLAGQAPPIGNRAGYRIELPVGVMVAFSYEQHREKQYRHLSMSVQGRLPNPVLVEQVMQQLGFANPVDRCLIYTEQNDTAMNVLEPASGELMDHGAWLPSPS